MRHSNFLSRSVFVGLLLAVPAQVGALERNSTPGAPGGAAAAADSGRSAATSQTPRIIVKYRDSASARAASGAAAVSSAEALSQRAGTRLQHIRTTGGNEQVLGLPGSQTVDEVRAIAARVAQDPDVEYAEPDARMQIQQVVNDTRFNEQWDLHGINITGAWQRGTGNGVVVAVIDTGFRPHVDLREHILPGFDFISDLDSANDGDLRDADATDPGDAVAAGECGPGSRAEQSSWHGTHVAGTIAAVTNNREGVAGIARDSRILPVRVLGKCGGFLSDIADGMRWAAGLPIPGVPNNPTPARVLNLSIGGPGACGPTYQSAMSEIRQKGVTIVVAAGNDRSDASSSRPANCTGVIPVAATNRQGGRAFYSNFGSIVQIAAPGGETNPNLSDGILSTLNSGASAPGSDNYAFYQGTSMAAPHVTGVVALLYGAKPEITPDEVATVLRRTAQPFPSTGTPCDTATCGAGILDAAAALNDVLGDKGKPEALPVGGGGPLEPR